MQGYLGIFSPDGETLLSLGFNRTFTLWDVHSRQSIGKSFQGHIDAVNSITFSPDGKTLASGSVDLTIILWDMLNKQPIGEPLRGHTGWVESITFSPDGKTLASGGHDGTIMLWDTDPESWLDRLCGIVGRNFSQEEWATYFPGEPYRKTCQQWPAGE